MRKEFEQWISSPPFERSIERYPDDHHRAGDYKEYELNLLWEAWKESNIRLSEAIKPYLNEDPEGL